MTAPHPIRSRSASACCSSGSPRASSRAAIATPWRMEWEAELRHRWSRGIDAVDGRRDAAWCDVRSARVVDAAWIRRQFTIDADVVHDVDARRADARQGAGVHHARAARARDRHRRRRPRWPAWPTRCSSGSSPIPDAERVVTVWERNLRHGRRARGRRAGQRHRLGDAADLVRGRRRRRTVQPGLHRARRRARGDVRPRA